MQKFSVVIPVYNRETVIARAVRSLQTQTCKDWELIIIDDGSVDGTAKAVEPFLSDSRIQYVRQENRGAQAARNHGLKLAKGEYLCFLDSDDELLPDFLAEMLAAYEMHPEVGCVYCWTEAKHHDGAVYLRKDTLEGDIYARALEQGYVTSPTFLTMKRNCFDVIGTWDESFHACQDDDICFRLAKHFRFRLIRRPLALYHAEYSGSENRIGASCHRVMNAWWQLWQKYEADVVDYCGQLTMWRHFMKCYKDFCSQGGDRGAIEAIWL